MMYITGHDRSQLLLLPEAVDDYVGSDNPVRFIDAFVDGLDLAAAGFGRVAHRMFRSAVDALNVLQELKDRGVSLHMIDLGGDVTSNGISKLVFTILSAVAEAERDRIRERVAEVKRDQRAGGRYLGGTPPFGWHVGYGGELIERPEQQAALRRIRALRAQG